MSKNMIIATLIGGVASFLLGWLVFGILLDPYYKSQMVSYSGLHRTHEEMRIYAIFISQLGFAALIAYVFDRLGNIRTFVHGFLHGFIIFFLAFLAFDMMLWSSMNLATYKMYVVDVLVNAVFGAIISGIIAYALGFLKK